MPDRRTPHRITTAQPLGEDVWLEVTVPCADVREDPDPELWFSHDPEDIALAKSICAGCPMRNPCLQRALEGKHWDGIWGATTGDERRALAKPKRVRKLRTHCGQGHEWTPENTLVTSKGRKCRQCNKDRNRAMRARAKVAS